MVDDNKIIELYLQRNDNAIKVSGEKYGSYCFSIAENILNNKEDSEECVNDTWFNAWNIIPPFKPKVLKMFFAKITRNLSFNRFKKNCAKKRGGGEIFSVLDELSECIADESNVEDETITNELDETIRRFIKNLPEREGNIFVRRYFFTEPVADIAERYNITTNNATVILSRLRQKLRKVLSKEGYFNE